MMVSDTFFLDKGGFPYSIFRKDVPIFSQYFRWGHLRGRQNKVPYMQIISGERVLEQEPHLTPYGFLIKNLVISQVEQFTSDFSLYSLHVLVTVHVSFKRHERQQITSLTVCFALPLFQETAECEA